MFHKNSLILLIFLYLLVSPDLVECGRRGGGSRGRSSSGRRGSSSGSIFGGLFGSSKPKPKAKNPQSSYPKQTYGGGNTRQQVNTGGGSKKRDEYSMRKGLH